VSTNAVANLIREGKTFQIPSTMQTGRSQGMFTFESHVTELVQKGLVTQEVANSFLGKTTPKPASANPMGGAKPGMPTPPLAGIKKPA